MYILYILERLFLAVPCQYVHSDLVLGLDWALASSLLYCIFLVCLGPPSSLFFVPTIHISDVHPPLTTRWLNTAIQVNNMGAWHLMYNGHIYITQCYYTILLLNFFYTFGHAGWPRLLMSGTLIYSSRIYLKNHFLNWFFYEENNYLFSLLLNISFIKGHKKWDFERRWIW